MLQKGEGIVIRTVDYGETNKIVTVFTREFGKTAFMARGAKKPKSPLSAVTQLFSYGYYLYQSGNSLGTLRQGEVTDAFPDLREDIYRTAYAAFIAELLDKLVDEKVPNPFLFESFYQALHYIDEGFDPEVISFIFETKMLDVAGIRPQLNQCVNCGEEQGPFVFSVREGGLLCSACSSMDPRHLKLSEASIKLLRLFLYMDMNRLGRVSLKTATRRELNTALTTYYDEFVGLKLKSKRFLDQLERMASDFY